MCVRGMLVSVLSLSSNLQIIRSHKSKKVEHMGGTGSKDVVSHNRVIDQPERSSLHL